MKQYFLMITLLVAFTQITAVDLDLKRDDSDAIAEKLSGSTKKETRNNIFKFYNYCSKKQTAQFYYRGAKKRIEQGKEKKIVINNLEKLKKKFENVPVMKTFHNKMACSIGLCINKLKQKYGY